MSLFGKRTNQSPETSKIRETTGKIQETAIAHQQVSREILDTAKTIQQTTKARQQVSGEMLDKARTYQEIAQQIQLLSHQNEERHSKLLDKWEKQAQRFDDILTKWEQMK
jgi:hypothetical protein